MEIEGLPRGPVNPWSYRNPQATQPTRGALRDDLRRLQPAFLILVARTPVFPACPEGFRRNALTLILVEVPVEGSP
jgi:hypothetical protein